MLGETLSQEIKVEWRGQSHIATGKLEKSLKVKVSTQIDRGDLLMDIYALSYYQDLETAPQGSFNTDELPDLIRWVRAKGLSLNKTGLGAARKGKRASDKSIAYAIVNSWQATGRPSPNAVAYSKNGRINGAIAYVIQKNDKIIDRLANEVDKYLDSIWT